MMLCQSAIAVRSNYPSMHHLMVGRVFLGMWVVCLACTGCWAYKVQWQPVSGDGQIEASL